MPIRRTYPLIFAAGLLLSACSVHTIDIQQGNIITPEMVEQLKPGMSRRQVKFVMGTPLIADPFHAERWDYLYTLRSRQGAARRHLALYFDGDTLTRIEDAEPAAPAAAPPTP